MLAWPLRPFRRAALIEAPDPAAELAVAQRLLPVSRDVLVVPGVEGAGELLPIVERLAPAGYTEVLCPPETGVAAIRALLARQLVVHDAAPAPRRSALILDRRLGWWVPGWEPLVSAHATACRLLWNRLGYYTEQAGTVEAVHPENALFSLEGRSIWVNTAYRQLPLPKPGARVRVLGLFSYLGSTLPVLHALCIESVIDPA
jgi:hypothetical protein